MLLGVERQNVISKLGFLEQKADKAKNAKTLNSIMTTAFQMLKENAPTLVAPFMNTTKQEGINVHVADHDTIQCSAGSVILTNASIRGVMDKIQNMIIDKQVIE